MGEEKFKRLSLLLLLIGKFIAAFILYRYYLSGKLLLPELKSFYFLMTILASPSFFLYLKDYLRNRKIKRYSQKLIRSQVVQLSFLFFIGYSWFYYYFMETTFQDRQNLRFYNQIVWFSIIEIVYGGYIGFFVFPLFRRRRSRLPKNTH